MATQSDYTELDFAKIEFVCAKNATMVKNVLDDVLLYYVAAREKLDKKVDRLLKPHRLSVNALPKSWTGFAKSQFIAHEIFRDGGLLPKLMQHSIVKDLSDYDIEWLRRQLATPWRYSYASIVSRPAKDFFVMFDEFTQQEYLLHSPGLGRDLQGGSVSLCFILIGFNGSCWQTYGGIISFRGVEKSDIYYFNDLLNPAPEPAKPEELMQHVAEDPIPYMLLHAGAETPFVYNKDTKMRYCIGEYDCNELIQKNLTSYFDTDYSMGVHRLALKNWDKIPHYATAYFDEDEEVLFLSAFTLEGYRKLAEVLGNIGYQLSQEPDFMVNPAFLATANEIAGYENEGLNPYEELFRDDNGRNPEELNRVNDGLAVMMDALNNDRKIDLKKLALETGIDPDSLQNLWKELQERIGK